MHLKTANCKNHIQNMKLATAWQQSDNITYDLNLLKLDGNV
jgi:hypothetical protein